MGEISKPTEQIPGIENFNFPDIATPWASSWWTTQWITQIPPDSVGWLLSQGWQITAVTYDEARNPPTPYYAMTREAINNLYVLQSLLNAYTVAYNDARFANQERYNEVVDSWTALISNTDDYFDEHVAEQNAHVSLFLGNLDTYMDEVDALIDSNQSQLVLDASVATDALTELNAKLDDLETNANANAVTVNTLLSNQSNYLTTFLSNFSNKLAELDTNYTAHLANMTALLTASDTDLATFAATQAPQLTAFSTAYTAHVAELEGLLSTATGDLAGLTGEVDAILAELETDYSAVDTEITALLTSGSTALNTYATDYETTLNLLVTDYNTVAAELNALRTTSDTDLTTHTALYNAEIAKLDPNYVDHVISATNLLEGLGAAALAKIDEEFNASLSTQLQHLIDVGMYSSTLALDVTARNTRDRNQRKTEVLDQLAREKWENEHRLYEQGTSISDRTMQARDRLHGITQDINSRHVNEITNRFQLQQSARDRTMAGTDRLHAVKQEVYRYQATQITNLYQLLQSVRDRTLSATTALYSLRDANTRLNLEVQSSLYEAGQTIRQRLIEEAARLQQLEQAVTQWQAGQRDRLLEQIQQIEVQNLAGLDKQHSAQQDVSRVAMGERDQLLSQLQEAVNGILSGKERYSALTMQNASTLAEHRHRAIVEKMNEFTTRLEGLRGTHTDNMKLMAYMLSEHNNLLVGLYGFAERREDIGPQFNDLAQITSALGGEGGGWLTP